MESGATGTVCRRERDIRAPESVTGGLIGTIEGNTDASKTREGGGVYRLTRKLLEINKGYIE
jgi:hypothetical protein